MTTGHPDRRNDQKLNLFRQELSIIDLTVNTQISILDGLLRRGESVARKTRVKLAEVETKPNTYYREREWEHMPIFSRGGMRRPRYDTMASMADEIFRSNDGGDLGHAGFSSVLLQECLRDLYLKKSDLEMMRDTADILKRSVGPSPTKATHSFLQYITNPPSR